MLTRRGSVWLGVCLLAWAAAPAASGEEGWAYTLAAELLSPYCPGRTLAECPSPQAQTLRVWLITQEAAGASREEVEQQLVERFGPGILPAPPASGFGLAAYVAPVLAFGVGGFLWWRFLRRQTRADAKPAARAPAVSPPPAGPAEEAEIERTIEREITG